MLRSDNNKEVGLTADTIAMKFFSSGIPRGSFRYGKQVSCFKYRGENCSCEEFQNTVWTVWICSPVSRVGLFETFAITRLTISQFAERGECIDTVSSVVALPVSYILLRSLSFIYLRTR